jgi:hypothetical protein
MTRKNRVPSPAGLVGSSAVLRLGALRPQLRRDPFGGMTRLELDTR